MKRFFFLTLVVALGLVLTSGLTGCGSDDDDNPGVPTVGEFDRLATLGDDYFTNYVTASGLGVNTTADKVYAIMTDANDDNDYYILDWRAPEHFALGHIAGAKNVGKVGTVNIEQVINDIPAGKVVLNVCYTGQSASYATSQMNMLGYEAQNLKFGMCGWTSDAAVNLGKWDNAISDDYATWLVKDEFTSPDMEAIPQWSTGKSDAKEILMERMKSGFTTGFKGVSSSALYQDIHIDGNADDWFVINYFGDTQYEGGHIPGAIQFVPKRDLRSDKLLETIPADKKVAVYCFTGQTSAQIIGYLAAMGYDAYTVLYGVNAMCYTNDTICSVKYHAPSTDYPVVTGS